MDSVGPASGSELSLGGTSVRAAAAASLDNFRKAVGEELAAYSREIYDSMSSQWDQAGASVSPLWLPEATFLDFVCARHEEEDDLSTTYVWHASAVRHAAITMLDSCEGLPDESVNEFKALVERFASHEACPITRLMSPCEFSSAARAAVPLILKCHRLKFAHQVVDRVLAKDAGREAILRERLTASAEAAAEAHRVEQAASSARQPVDPLAESQLANIIQKRIPPFRRYAMFSLEKSGFVPDLAGGYVDVAAAALKVEEANRYAVTGVAIPSFDQPIAGPRYISATEHASRARYLENIVAHEQYPRVAFALHGEATWKDVAFAYEFLAPVCWSEGPGGLGDGTVPPPGMPTVSTIKGDLVTMHMLSLTLVTTSPPMRYIRLFAFFTGRGPLSVPAAVLLLCRVGVLYAGYNKAAPLHSYNGRLYELHCWLYNCGGYRFAPTLEGVEPEGPRERPSELGGEIKVAYPTFDPSVPDARDASAFAGNRPGDEFEPVTCHYTRGGRNKRGPVGNVTHERVEAHYDGNVGRHPTQQPTRT